MSKRALLIGHEQNYRRILEAQFQRHGFDAFLAADFGSASELLEQQSVDVVVIDLYVKDDSILVRLPGWARSLAPLPMVLLSAYEHDQLSVAAVLAGIDHVFIKPVDIDELVAAVESELVRQREIAAIPIFEAVVRPLQIHAPHPTNG